MKRILRILWKSLLGLTAIVLVFVGVVFAKAWCEEQNSYYVDDYLSDKVSIRYYYKKEEFRLYNSGLRKFTAKGFDQVVDAADGDSLTVFFKQNLRGYINVNTGYIEIPAQYHHAWVFSEGLAAVADSNGKIGFINKENEVVIPFQFYYREDAPVDYVFHDGYCVMTDSRGACGIIDRSGHWVMEPQYDGIWAQYFGKYRMVKDGDKYGLIDENLEFIFPIEYDWIEYSSQECDGVILQKGHIKQQVAYDGTILNPFVIDGCSALYYVEQIPPTPMSDDDGNTYLATSVSVLSDYLLYRIDYNEGVMLRETGEVIIPALYEGIEMISPTLFYAELKDVDGGILFDLNGCQVE